MSYIKTHAPYAHLVKNDNYEYTLYILIPILDDEKIDGELIEYLNGSTLISFSVRSYEGDLEKLFLKKIALKPKNFENGYTFDPDTFSVRITCKNQSNVTRRTIIHYEDAITRDTAFSDDDEKVHNRPYMYLTNPNTETSTPEKGFDPYCMFYLKGFKNPSFSEDKASYEQSYTQVISLEVNGSTIGKWIDPAIITCNDKKYNDTRKIIGSFYVDIDIVTLGTGRKRRGRLRNSDSDTNPNTFIDF
jgi:hypothetical protein